VLHSLLARVVVGVASAVVVIRGALEDSLAALRPLRKPRDQAHIGVAVVVATVGVGIVKRVLVGSARSIVAVTVVVALSTRQLQNRSKPCHTYLAVRARAGGLIAARSGAGAGAGSGTGGVGGRALGHLEFLKLDCSWGVFRIW
jgi:hypothetical protein